MIWGCFPAGYAGGEGRTWQCRLRSRAAIAVTRSHWAGGEAGPGGSILLLRVRRPWLEKLAAVQVAGWSTIQRPRGVASSGLAVQGTQSARWGQQQGM